MVLANGWQLEKILAPKAKNGVKGFLCLYLVCAVLEFSVGDLQSTQNFLLSVLTQGREIS